MRYIFIVRTLPWNLVDLARGLEEIPELLSLFSSRTTVKGLASGVVKKSTIPELGDLQPNIFDPPQSSGPENDLGQTPPA
jgi:hypothetical protein